LMDIGVMKEKWREGFLYGTFWNMGRWAFVFLRL
jgi:hypothetical protein